MKLAVMQPYFMPYIGYWQVMNIVDKYVIYDDVSYIKGGWINRNRILINDEAKYINIPMIGASSNKKINEIEVSTDKVLADKNVRKLEMAYQRAPYFSVVMPILEEILYCQEKNLNRFLQNSMMKMKEYLDINAELVLSSEIEKDEGLKAEERLLDICSRLGAREYYNAIGGKELYSKAAFERAGIELHFVQTEEIKYMQFSDKFIPWLSIIDVMMFNDAEKIKIFLDKYNLQ